MRMYRHIQSFRKKNDTSFVRKPALDFPYRLAADNISFAVLFTTVD